MGRLPGCETAFKEYPPVTAEQIGRLVNARPADAVDLHHWVYRCLGLYVPRHKVCKDHCAPFEYLWSAYEQEFSDAVVWACRGGGKTMLGAVVTLLDALFRPGAAIRILGGSLEQSEKMYRYLLGLLLPRFAGRVAKRGGRGQRDALTARCVRLDNGSEIEILAQSERSVRGNRVQKMRCDEIELFDTDVWTSCQLVTESKGAAAAAAADASNPKSGVQVRNPQFIRGAVEAFSTLHRPHGLMQELVSSADRRGSPLFRWCVLDVMERCPEGRDCGTCPLGDDCRGRLKHPAVDGFVRYADALAAWRRVSRETWEAEMLCLRPSRRGAVFPAFSRERHVAPLRYRPTWPIFRAIDFGFVHPFVCLWMQADPSGNVYVLREYLRSKATLFANAEAVRRLDPGPVRASYCDPAGSARDQITGTTPRGELLAAGIRTRARPSRIHDGLEVVRRFLDGDRPGGPERSGRPGLLIDPSCARLIEAMEAYRYPGPGERGNPELPVKDGVHDHPIDALRYFFINHLAGRLSAVVERRY